MYVGMGNYIAWPICGQGSPALPNPGLSGYSGLGCGCGCGGGCAQRGLGLFDSGFDWTQWGWSEWLTVGIGAYVLWSVFFTTRTGYRQGKERVRHARKRIARTVGG